MFHGIKKNLVFHIIFVSNHRQCSSLFKIVLFWIFIWSLLALIYNNHYNSSANNFFEALYLRAVLNILADMNAKNEIFF